MHVKCLAQCLIPSKHITIDDEDDCEDNWSFSGLESCSFHLMRREGDRYRLKLGAGEVDVLSEGLISEPLFYLLTPYILPLWCPVPGCCQKPFAPKPSQRVVWPSPSYNASKHLFFLFNFATVHLNNSFSGVKDHTTPFQF